MLIIAVLSVRPESQSCQNQAHNPGNFSVDRAARVNYAPLRARKITRVFAAAVATSGLGRGGVGGGGECGVEISRCFDRDLSGCFGCNHPGDVTTIIFAAPRRLPRCNQFRRRITLLRLSRRLQRLRNESEIGSFGASAPGSIHPIRRPAAKPSFAIYFAIETAR